MNKRKREEPDDWDASHKFINLATFKDDTSQSQARGREGKGLELLQSTNYLDVQGIPWKAVTSLIRSSYRYERMTQYDAHHTTGSLDESRPLGEFCDLENLTYPKDNGLFFEFRQNSRKASCSLTHFQLRHLVNAVSPYEVYHMDDYSIWQWNCAASAEHSPGVHTKIMDLKKTGGLVHDDDDMPGVLVSTMAAHGSLVAVGGFKGECIVKNTSSNSIVFNKRLTDSKSAITNYIDLSPACTLVASNDQSVRVFDTSTFTLNRTHTFGYCINNASKKDNLMSIVGDTDAVLVCDVESGAIVHTLKGHLDFSFASAWHPRKSHILATGSQDNTTRIWDLRKANLSLHTIVGCLGPIRSLHFSEDGRFLAAAEPADFIHVYDVQADYQREQQIDLFGEIAGVCFGPGDGGQTLFAGLYDKTYKSLLEFSRVRHGKVMESILI